MWYPNLLQIYFVVPKFYRSKRLFDFVALGNSQNKFILEIA